MENLIQQQRYAKRFAAIESSFRVEGLDPSGDPLYEEIKVKVLAGDMTPQEAHAFVVEAAVRRTRAAA